MLPFCCFVAFFARVGSGPFSPQVEEQQLLATSVAGRTILMYAARCTDQMGVLCVTHACRKFLQPSKVSCSHVKRTVRALAHPTRKMTPYCVLLRWVTPYPFVAAGLLDNDDLQLRYLLCFNQSSSDKSVCSCFEHQASTKPGCERAAFPDRSMRTTR